MQQADDTVPVLKRIPLKLRQPNNANSGEKEHDDPSGANGMKDLEGHSRSLLRRMLLIGSCRTDPTPTPPPNPNHRAWRQGKAMSGGGACGYRLRVLSLRRPSNAASAYLHHRHLRQPRCPISNAAPHPQACGWLWLNNDLKKVVQHLVSPDGCGLARGRRRK